mmetsp:Transcript_26221/g.47331  ORF Transcript_26221/g.47331 Transcript_26221/m.47331 type:complete len:152 (-) Transcript_26221:1918-2373(-)
MSTNKSTAVASFAVDTVIIGGGQAGLAMSRCLQDYSVSHIILERKRLAERWRSERWDSLRLLTPNWMTRLPGNYQYQGHDPDGYMTASETIKFFQEYADSFTLRSELSLLASPPNCSRQRLSCSAQSWRDARERNLYFRYAVRNDAFFQLY